MRLCNVCKKEKQLDEFRKISIWRAHICKKCHAEKYRSGKPNFGRFKEGSVPWNKGKTGIKKRENPRYIKKGRPITNSSLKRNEWGLAVRTRDGNKCKVCESTDDITAHHIVPWKKDESKRFEIDNGISLCRKCHSFLERYIDMRNGKYNLPNTNPCKD